MTRLAVIDVTECGGVAGVLQDMTIHKFQPLFLAAVIIVSIVVFLAFAAIDANAASRGGNVRFWT